MTQNFKYLSDDEVREALTFIPDPLKQAIRIAGRIGLQHEDFDDLLDQYIDINSDVVRNLSTNALDAVGKEVLGATLLNLVQLEVLRAFRKDMGLTA